MLVLLTRLEPGPEQDRPGSLALSPLEAARAGRLKGLRRRQYLAGRRLLREACARAGGGPPAAWALSAEGLPLARRDGQPGPWLSLAHSGDWVAAAAGPQPGVGLDLERRDQARDWKGLHRLLRRWKLPPARPAWPMAPAEAAFLGDWTRYEAAYKACHSLLAAGRRPGMVRAWTLLGKDAVLSVCTPDDAVPAWAWLGPGGLREWRRCPRPWTLDLSRMRP